jgi:hypothetical protein
MTTPIVLSALVAFFVVLFYWAFRNLPAEHWQIIAAVPSQRREDGTWNGINLTYYGFFNASACVFSCATVFTLMGSVEVPGITTVLIICLLLLVCLPAAKLLARIIERKSSTFTIGGASFVGVVLLPLIIQAFNSFAAESFGLAIPPKQTLAAVAIAYAFGEAFGRLACISFGCCYGKLLWQAPLRLQKVLRRFCFTFSGDTKKVAYEADLLQRPLIPIQAATAIISALAGISGLFFFLNSQWTTAMLLPIVVTQVWRVISELLRADYRGGGRISAYQLMAIAALVYSLGWATFLHATPSMRPNVLLGLRNLFNAPVILFLEILWLAIFLYMGRSSVTGATLSFHVVREKI